MITSFNNGPFTVTRTAAPTYDKGRQVKGAGTTFDVDGCIQPLTDRELLILPEGKRTKETRKLYTDAVLYPVGSAPGDRVSVDGEMFEVYSKSGYPGSDIPHYKYVLTKEAP